MTLGQFLIAGWTWHPEIILGCLGIAIAYTIQSKFRWGRKSAYFHLGLLLLALALLSPLDVLSDDYLFSAHMLQHLILVLFAAPLLLLGIPMDWIAQLLKWRVAARSESILGRPAVSWAIGVGILYLWHLPALYNLALGNETIHALQHLSFLVGATIFWWPVILPIQGRRRLSPLGCMLYIFAGAAANIVLGIVITFAPVELYPFYTNPEDTFGILSIIRNGLGLIPQTDQQLGGLLMWIPGGLVYLGAILIVLANWFNQPDLEVT